MNITNSSNNLSFNAKFSPKFLEIADCYHKNLRKNTIQASFDNAVDKFSKFPDTENITIHYKKIFENGHQQYLLIAENDITKEKSILLQKDELRMLLKAFSFLEECEFINKLSEIKRG